MRGAGPQRAAVRARSGDHRRRPADDAAGGRQHQMPDHVHDRAGRPAAAALAADARHHQRGECARAVHHGADRGAPGRPAARAGTVAQSVPDPSKLQGDRKTAAGRTAGALAPSGRARRDPERGRRPRPTIRCSSGRTTTRCICSAIRRITSSRWRMRSARRRRRQGKKPEELAYDAMLEEKAAACSTCRSSTTPTAISTPCAKC